MNKQKRNKCLLHRTIEVDPVKRRSRHRSLLNRIRETAEKLAAKTGAQVALVNTSLDGRSLQVTGTQPLAGLLEKWRSVIEQDMEMDVVPCARKMEEVEVYGKEPSDLPPLVSDGVRVPLQCMTQAELRSFIPFLLKLTSGSGKTGWDNPARKPPWWPIDIIPWCNIRTDGRTREQKGRMSYRCALKEVVRACYLYHGRRDLLGDKEDPGDGNTEVFVSKSEGGKIGDDDSEVDYDEVIDRTFIKVNTGGDSDGKDDVTDGDDANTEEKDNEVKYPVYVWSVTEPGKCDVDVKETNDENFSEDVVSSENLNRSYNDVFLNYTIKSNQGGDEGEIGDVLDYRDLTMNQVGENDIINCTEVIVGNDQVLGENFNYYSGTNLVENEKRGNGFINNGHDDFIAGIDEALVLLTAAQNRSNDYDFCDVNDENSGSSVMTTEKARFFSEIDNGNVYNFSDVVTENGDSHPVNTVTNGTISEEKMLWLTNGSDDTFDLDEIPKESSVDDLTMAKENCNSSFVTPMTLFDTQSGIEYLIIDGSVKLQNDCIFFASNQGDAGSNVVSFQMG